MTRKNTVLAVLALLLVCLMPVRAAAFSDVHAGDWFAKDVDAMTGDGLLRGYPDDTFRPNDTITAAEFVSVVARCGGIPDSVTYDAHWAAGTMQAALDAGWYDWDEIPPSGEKYDKPIVRQLAVSILMRALLPDKSGDYSTETAKIADFSQVDGRYFNKIIAAYSCGVAQGDNLSLIHI